MTRFQSLWIGIQWIKNLLGRRQESTYREQLDKEEKEDTCVVELSGSYIRGCVMKLKSLVGYDHEQINRIKKSRDSDSHYAVFEKLQFDL